MNIRFVMLAAACPTLLLSGCSTKNVWEFYDSCSQSSSFVSMVDCGKQKRMAHCQSSRCSREGDAFAEYADALAVGVQRNELTESEARQRFIKFKTQLMLAEDSDDAMVGAALAGGMMANRPRQCFRNGPYVNCF